MKKLLLTRVNLQYISENISQLCLCGYQKGRTQTQDTLRQAGDSDSTKREHYNEADVQQPENPKYKNANTKGSQEKAGNKRQQKLSEWQIWEWKKSTNDKN